MSEKIIEHYAKLALHHNAKISSMESVIRWEVNNGEVSVTTNKSNYKSDSLVITAGSWINKLVPELLNLAVPERQVLGWFKTRNDNKFKKISQFFHALLMKEDFTDFQFIKFKVLKLVNIII